jgi:MoaA/NifB/PqqE/SkfB family radical SAM enzyme
MPIWGNIYSQENIFYHKNVAALEFIQHNIERAERKAKECNVNLLNSLPFSVSFENKAIEYRNENMDENGGLLCHMPWKRMVINPAGYVCPACHCKEMVGNVTEDTLDDIWNNNLMQRYRQKLVNRNYKDLCNQDCIKGFISEELRGLR